MKQFKKFADNQFEKLADLFEDYESTAKNDVLHGLRVAFKKLKAGFRLIEYCTDKFDSKQEYSSLKEIFSKAGEIREIEVSNALFKEYKIKMNSEKYSNDHSLKLISEFRKNVPVYKKSIAKKSRAVEKDFENVNRKCYSKYLKKRQDDLQKLTYPVLMESQLHKSRKIIKEIIYLSSISRWRKKHLPVFYDEVQDLIGKWHDKILLIELLKNLGEESGRNVSEKLRLKCRSELNLIGRLIEEFYSREDSGKLVIYKSDSKHIL